MNLRYITFNSLTAFVAAYAIFFHNALSLLWTYEKTHISLVIIAVYIACTVYLGWFGEKANFKSIRYYSERLPALGLIGTVVAILLLFSAASDTNFKTHLLLELAPVFLTTIFGIGSSFLLDLQMALCFDEHN